MRFTVASLMAFLILASAAVLLAAPVAAQVSPDKPLLTAERLHIGASIRYASWSAPQGTLLTTFKKEFEVGLPVAYNLNRFDIVGGGFYLTDSKAYRWTIGIAIELPIAGGAKVSQ